MAHSLKNTIPHRIKKINTTMITQVLGKKNSDSFTTLYPTCLAMLVAKPFKCGATLMHCHAMDIQVLIYAFFHGHPAPKLKYIQSLPRGYRLGMNSCVHAYIPYAIVQGNTWVSTPLHTFHIAFQCPNPQTGLFHARKWKRFETINPCQFSYSMETPGFACMVT